MNDEPTDLAARFLQGVGLAELPLEVVERQMSTYGRGSPAEYQRVGSTTKDSEALAFLSTLTWPATRYVLFASSDNLTALINNSRNGSDFADEVYRLPQHLECRFARVVNCPQRVWRRGKLREVQQYGARIFDLHDARGETIRSIACINDGGRWVYHSAGLPHPFEAAFSKAAERPSVRFPSEQLIAVASAFGFPPPTSERFRRAARYLMFTQEQMHPITTCTIAEADDPAYGYFLRGMGYVQYMATHAASVVADFECCLAINPEYEPRVREHLLEARRRLNK